MAVIPVTDKVSVTTAGTRVPLLSSTKTLAGTVVGLSVQCNTSGGVIYIGDSTVTSTNGQKLVAGSMFVFPLYAANGIDPRQIYIDAGTSGDSLSILYFLKI